MRRQTSWRNTCVPVSSIRTSDTGISVLLLRQFVGILALRLGRGRDRVGSAPPALRRWRSSCPGPTRRRIKLRENGPTATPRNRSHTDPALGRSLHVRRVREKPCAMANWTTLSSEIAPNVGGRCSASCRDADAVLLDFLGALGRDRDQPHHSCLNLVPSTHTCSNTFSQ